MQIEQTIDVRRGQYHAQIAVTEFTAQEQEKIADHGEPLVDAGGSFSGTESRPGQTDTTISFSGGGGSGTTAEPEIDPETGEITAINVTNGGSGYTSPPTVEINGDGSGASATASISGGSVDSITVDSPGSGYNEVPVTVSFTLPTNQRRLKSGFPFKEIFDMGDDPNSDIKAKIWIETIQNRMVTERDRLLQQKAYFEQRNITTV